MPKQQITDPYAPPPLHKSKTGPLIRGVIIAGLLVVGGAIACPTPAIWRSRGSTISDQTASNLDRRPGWPKANRIARYKPTLSLPLAVTR